MAVSSFKAAAAALSVELRLCSRIETSDSLRTRIRSNFCLNTNADRLFPGKLGPTPVMYRSNPNLGQIEASTSSARGIPRARAFDTFAVPGRREFDYQGLPGGGEFDPHAPGMGNLN